MAGPDDQDRDERRRREREARERARERARTRGASAARDRGREGRRRVAPEPIADADLPDFAAPSTRAGRERRAVFAPAMPAASKPAADGGARPRNSGGAERGAALGAALGPLVDRARDLPRAALAASAVLVALLVGGLAVAIGGGGGPERETATGQAAERPEPRRKSPYGTPTETVLPPKTRVVAYTGAPQADELGILGTMPFEQASDRLDRQAKPYARKTRPVLRAFDLIATIADADPGPAGKYRTRQTPAVIARYLRAARRHDAALILDVQPGGSNFVDELRPLARWLKEPDVHLALDPEWRMRPGVRPGSEIGYVSAGEITATLSRVAKIVRDHDLPPKLVLVHRFTDGMIRDLPAVRVPDEIVGVISIDGVGSRALKEATYDRIAPRLPKPWLPGFKVFYEEDAAAGGVMYGADVMALRPRPHVVLYE